MGYDGLSMVKLYHIIICSCVSFSCFLECGPIPTMRKRICTNPRRHHMKLNVQEHDQRRSRRTKAPNPALMLRQILSGCGRLVQLCPAPNVNAHLQLLSQHCMNYSFS